MHYILILWLAAYPGAALVVENDDAATCISNGKVLVLSGAKLARNTTPNGCFAKGGKAPFVQKDVDAVEAFNASIPGN